MIQRLKAWYETSCDSTESVWTFLVHDLRENLERKNIRFVLEGSANAVGKPNLCSDIWCSISVYNSCYTEQLSRGELNHLVSQLRASTDRKSAGQPVTVAVWLKWQPTTWNTAANISGHSKPSTLNSKHNLRKPKKKNLKLFEQWAAAFI